MQNKCINKKCKSKISKPGRCKICNEIWSKTLETVRKAFAMNEEIEVCEIEVSPTT